MKRKLISDEQVQEEDSKIFYLTKDRKSWFQLYKPLPESILTDTILDDLWLLCPLEDNYIKIFGKDVKVPRYQQAYSDIISHYRFSGVNHKSLPPNSLLKRFIDYANSLNEDFKFNMCFVNWYKDGSQYIGYHGDDESQLYQDKKGNINILSISIGETRRFLLKPNDKSKGFKHETNLTHGSVVLMAGLTQSTHKHSVPKVTGKKASEMGRRVNLTFRRFL